MMPAPVVPIRERWPAVSRRNPCPICGRPKNCQVSPDGSVALCRRVTLGAFKVNDRDEAFHRLRETAPSSLHVARRPIAPDERADPAVLNASYSLFLGALALSGAHAAQLERRGLSQEAVTRNLYATVPTQQEARRVLAELRGMDFDRVPGFHVSAGERRMVDTPEGFFVPVRDHRGFIVGMQVRLDRPVGAKYIWFSSSKRLRGASPGAPLHFADSYLAERRSDRIVLTEGPLKADIVADRLHLATVAVAGINAAPDAIGLKLRDAFPHIKNVLLAPDADYREKPEVAKGAARIGVLLSKVGFRVYVVTWNPDAGKGLDDVATGHLGVA